MCIWCSAKYSQCTLCFTVYCDGCGESIAQATEMISQEQLYYDTNKYDAIHTLFHKDKQCEYDYDSFIVCRWCHSIPITV